MTVRFLLENAFRLDRLLFSDSSIIKSTVKLTDGMFCHIYGGEIECWLTSVLGIYATLARRTHDSQMTLANEGAFLLVYEESVRQIRNALDKHEQMTHERFRPNLVVDRDELQSRGYSAYSEDLWKRLVVQQTDDRIEFQTMGLCQRCSIVNIDPSTGTKQSQLFTRLQTQRREKHSFRANFGILLNLSNEDKRSFLHVGDRIQALM